MNTSTNSLAPATNYSAVVGNVLAQLREREKLNQGQAAQGVGVTQGTWSRIEGGSSVLTVEQLAEFAKKFGMKPHEVLKHADDAVEELESRKIRVDPKRKEWDLKSGWVLVGVTVLAVVIAAVLARKK